VPTAPAHFDDLERAGAYFYRKLGSEVPEFIAARASLVHTDPETGLSFQTYAVSRPKGVNLYYLDEAEITARYRLVPSAKAKDWWDGEVGKIPPLVNKTVFLLSGALIPVWRQIKNVKDAAFKIVRTTTDEGVRLVGLQIPKTQVKEIVRLFDCAWQSDDTSSEIFQSVLFGKESLELVENIRLKSSKFFGDFYVEVVPGRAEHPKKFRAMGFTSITQNSRERFLLPQNEPEAVSFLQKLVTQFPPVAGTYPIAQTIGTKPAEAVEIYQSQFAAESVPIDVREWVIEPEREELARICLPVSLIA